MGKGTTPPPTPGKNRLPSSGSSASAEGKGKKPNTLNDLIETERSYVELLAGIIRVCVVNQMMVWVHFTYKSQPESGGRMVSL